MIKKYKEYFCMLKTFDGKYTFAIKHSGCGYEEKYILMIIHENRRQNTIKELLWIASFYPKHECFYCASLPEIISCTFGKYKLTNDVIDLYKYKIEFVKMIKIYEYILNKNTINNSSYNRFKNVIDVYFEYRDKIKNYFPYL